MKLFLALDNIRSNHNVGSLMRTAFGFELDGVITVGITPHPKVENDKRLPHVIARAEKAISKTALGGEQLFLDHFEDNQDFLEWSQSNNLQIICIELTDDAAPIEKYRPIGDAVIVLGNEIKGISAQLLDKSNERLYIPISKNKESYNVANAGSIAMYALHSQFAKLKS